MTLTSVLLSLGALLLSIVSFLFGKLFSQSEKILDQKRRVYDEFLRKCPHPNEAHGNSEFFTRDFRSLMGVLVLYGSGETLEFAGEYINLFSEAQEELANVTEPGHPKYIELMSYYNRMLWAMRNDVMTLSWYAPKRAAREYKQGVFQDHN